jgi:hypothetical protein
MDVARGTVRVFRQKFTLEDAIGCHACSLEANMRLTNGIPLGSPLLLPVDTVNCVATLKALGAPLTKTVRCELMDRNLRSRMLFHPTPAFSPFSSGR